MKLTSTAFAENTMMPAKYTCDADNISPPLTITDIPENTKSLTLIMDDPDAPNGDWVHWLVWNISPTTTEIPENFSASHPENIIEGITDFGESKYGGACPPSGVHHYHFRLYALDTTLSLTSSTDKKTLEEGIKTHIIAQAELIGLYQRQTH